MKRYFTEVEPLTSLPKYIQALESYDDNLCILKRLHEEGILPEPVRQNVVKQIGEVSTANFSSNFIKERICGKLLTPAETDSLTSNLKEVVFSSQDDIISEIVSKWDGEEEPENLFSDLTDTLYHIQGLEKEIESEQASLFLEKIQQVVSEMEEKRALDAEYETLDAEEISTSTDLTIRSIFEDVDE